MKYLIIGLGNPGVEYKNTRHNVGFKVLDVLVSKSDTSFTTSRYADIAKIKYKGRRLILLKPNTFMNLSGKAINYWMYKLKIEINNILIISDDIALPFGELRIRKKGSDGGHNGLKNINTVLGQSDYARLRFGIDNDFLKGKQSEYVLDNWTSEQMALLEEKIDKAVIIVKSYCTIGIDQTMNNLNGK